MKLKWLSLILVGIAAAATLFVVRWPAPSTEQPPSYGSPSWSPDGKTIAFYSELDSNAEIYVMNAAGSPPTRLTHDTNTPASNGYPNFSPDGKKIAFDSKRDGNYEIYVMNADGSGSATRLTHTVARNVSASWSPDGRHIAFMSDRNGQFEIWLINADGSNPAQLTNCGEQGGAWFPRFSPDGSKLAFHIGRDVHVMNRSDSRLTRLTTDPANGMYPDWSPDGRRIVFMSWRDGPTEIYTMDADGSNQRRLTHTPQGDSIDPRWSPDGSHIVYVHVPQGLSAAGPKVIRIMNADGTGDRQLR